jgi:type II secretion system protein C
MGDARGRLAALTCRVRWASVGSSMLGALLALLVSSAAPDVEVVGVVVSRDSARSVAILRSAGRTRVAAIGETTFGGRLLAVGADGATLDFGEGSVRLRLLASTSAPPPRAAPVLPRGGPPEDPATPARAMERREVDRRLSTEIPRILAETAVSPVMEDGQVAGLLVTRIPDGSLLTDAGLRAGDVLREINDTRIDGMGALIGLWPRLQNATELHAVVTRNGQPVSLSVTLK